MSEDNLNMIIGISEIILFLTLTILAFYLINFMKKFLKSISSIENEVVEIADQLSPVIIDMKFITDDIKVIVDKSRNQFKKIEEVTDEITDKGKDLLETIDKVQTISNSYLNNGLNLISALSNGIRTFKSKLFNGAESKNKYLN